MAKNLTATDRKALIRLASTMEKGSEERRVILSGLGKTMPKTADEAPVEPLKVKLAPEGPGGSRPFALSRVKTVGDVLKLESLLEDAYFTRGEGFSSRTRKSLSKWGLSDSQIDEIEGSELVLYVEDRNGVSWDVDGGDLYKSAHGWDGSYQKGSSGRRVILSGLRKVARAEWKRTNDGVSLSLAQILNLVVEPDYNKDGITWRVQVNKHAYPYIRDQYGSLSGSVPGLTGADWHQAMGEALEGLKRRATAESDAGMLEDINKVRPKVFKSLGWDSAGVRRHLLQGAKRNSLEWALKQVSAPGLTLERAQELVGR